MLPRLDVHLQAFQTAYENNAESARLTITVPVFPQTGRTCGVELHRLLAPWV